MKYANRVGYSDVDPYEVVGVKGKGLVIRKMAVGKRLVDPVWQGGYCVNAREVKHELSSDASYPEIVIRPSKKLPDNYRKDKYGNRYVLAEEPQYYHDYNF